MTVAQARAFRQRPAAAEASLWDGLRSRRLAGLKFRRQLSIGRYVADFACAEARLVIELDGPFHDAEHDQGRTQVIEAAGWSVLRFPSKAVVEARAGVLAAILRHIEANRGE
jgi:very-short-patch-repair endonuclease